MLMPIVSMNKMAMNESVAATCCYQEKASPTNVYWQVLNGGWIGAGYADVSNFNLFNATTNGWKSYGRDISGWKSGALPVLKKNLDGYWVVSYGKNGNPQPEAATSVDSDGNTIYWGFLDHWVHEVGVSIGSDCSHNDATCAYFVSNIQWMENQHFEAKTAHNVKTSGQDWRKPHDVLQFNS